MALAKIFEGTWDQLIAISDEFRSAAKLTLIVPTQPVLVSGREQNDLSPQERIRLLDELAGKSSWIPTLPETTFERENLYSDELGLQ